MSKDEKDLRFRKTDYAIKLAFWNLVGSVGIAQVSIKALIKKAQINRTTFYHHYANKSELLASVEEDLLQTLKQQANKLPVEELKGGHASQVLPDYYRSLVTTIVTQREKLAILFSEDGDPAFKQKFIEMDTERLKSLALDQQSKIPVTYLLAGSTGLVVALIAEWAQQGFQESVEEFTAIIEQMLTPLIVSGAFGQP